MSYGEPEHGAEDAGDQVEVIDDFAEDDAGDDRDDQTDSVFASPW